MMSEEQREKTRVTLISVGSAVALTVSKLMVGVATGIGDHVFLYSHRGSAGGCGSPVWPRAHRESVRRIFVVSVPVERSIWTFLVMGASIAVDFWRSRMLAAAAVRYHSKALEADALNFRADMYSSSVVIVGLALTYLGGAFGLGVWLEKADAAAALVVALVIIRLSGGLARRAIGVLVDQAPVDVQDAMSKASPRYRAWSARCPSG